MTDRVFEQLAEALNRLPNGFPRTESGVEIRILKKIFPPEQAALACQLTGEFEPVDGIAQRTGQPAEEVSRRLFKMVRAGMVWLDRLDGQVCFRLAPFAIPTRPPTGRTSGTSRAIRLRRTGRSRFTPC